MEYFDEQSFFEFKMIAENVLRCWHSTGSSIVITVTVLDDRSLRMHSEYGEIFRDNEKLFTAVERAYQHWGLI